MPLENYYMTTLHNSQSDATAPEVPENEAQSHPLINLCRAWMRCDNAADRALFLSDVRAAHPDLWEQASKEGTDP